MHLNRCRVFKRSGQALVDAADTREREYLAQISSHRPTSLSTLDESSEVIDNVGPHESGGDDHTFEEPLSPVPSMIIRRSLRPSRKPLRYRDDELTDSEGEVMS